MCSFAQKVGLCGRLDPLGLTGHLSASVRREFRALWEVVARRLLCHRLSEHLGNSLWLPWGLQDGFCASRLPPREGWCCCVFNSQLSSAVTSPCTGHGEPWRRGVALSGNRCQLGSLSPVLRRCVWKCVWSGAGARSRGQWSVAFSLISLSVGGPVHSCLQN